MRKKTIGRGGIASAQHKLYYWVNADGTEALARCSDLGIGVDDCIAHSGQDDPTGESRLLRAHDRAK